MKFLTIEWNAEISEYETGRQIPEVSKKMQCPAVQLIIELLKKTPNEIKELRLIQLPRQSRLFKVEDIHEGKVFLEKMRVLQVSEHVDFKNKNSWLLRFFRPLQRPMLPDIIAAAPNLKEFKKEILPDEDVNAAVPERMTHIVKHLNFSPSNLEEDEIYEKFASRNPKLTTFASSLRIRNHLERSTWLTMRKLIVSSRSTLKEFHFDAYIASMLVPLRIPSLPNVQPLAQLTIDYRPQAMKVREELLKLNFTRLLPNVTVVEIFEKDRRIVNFVDFCDYFPYTETLNEDDESPDDTEGNTARVKEVRLRSFTSDQLDKGSVEFIFSLFPHAEKLSVCDSLCIAPYELIWERGSHIKELALDYNGAEEIENMDGIFCGLRHEEAERLQKESDEVLMALNFAPTSPSILHSRK